MESQQDRVWNVTSVHKLPSSTPAAGVYPNLIGSTQYARNNFDPGKKRPYRRIPSAEENPFALERILKKYWGHSQFRGPQKEICEAVTKGQDVVLVAPTGLGKSVCFQVPALAMEYGITLVISPLLALMKDQVRGLKAKGIKAEMLYEKSPPQEMAYVKKQLRMGHPELRLLYVTPETLFSTRISEELRVANKQGQLIRLVIDEAHVIEEWGMTFRGAYRDLGRFRETYPDVPITALTASATEEVRNDILETLRIDKKCLMQRVEPFNRRNLFYEVRYQGRLEEHERIVNLAGFINGYRPDAYKRNKLHGIKSDTVTGLVYCRYTSLCDDVAEGLKSHNIKAMAFHAKLSDEKRTQLLEAWQAGEIECIVATIAFGMGVDQANVRYVIHFNMPKSFEGYYQETGRAGRDGHLSRCLLYYSREDALSQRGLIQKEAAAADAMRKKIAKKEGTDTEIISEKDQAARTRCMNSFKDLQHYAEGDRMCRHVAICQFFGEAIDIANENELKTYCDKMCDVCSNPAAVRRRAFALTEDFEIASQAVRPQKTMNKLAYVPAISQIDEMSEGTSTPSTIDAAGRLEATQKEHLPSSLRDLHGSDLQIPSSAPAYPPARTKVALQKEESVDMVMPSSTPPEAVSDAPTPDGFDLDDIGDLAQDGDVNFGKALFPSSEDTDAAGSSDPLNLRSPARPPARTLQRPHEPIAGPSNYAQRTREPLRDLGNQSDQRRTSDTRVPVSEPTKRMGSRMDQPDRSTHESPCPPPGQVRPNAKPKPVRTGPSALLNARRGTVMTMDALDAGRYAVAEELPLDPEKRQRQHEAFRAVTPITGRGPYSYYTNTAAPMTGRKRKLSASSETGPSFRTPFKPPVYAPPARTRVGTISKEHRMAAIATIKEALKKSLVDGAESNRLWRHWGEKGVGRKGVYKAAAVELESMIVRDCAAPDILRDTSESVAQTIRILRTREGAKIVTGGKLQDYAGDEHGKWLILVDQVIRQME